MSSSEQNAYSIAGLTEFLKSYPNCEIFSRHATTRPCGTRRLRSEPDIDLESVKRRPSIDTLEKIAGALELPFHLLR